jgi:thiamine biosynthesis lipoprotein
VVSSGQAVVTSSTRRRTWAANGEQRHIVDPRPGRTASTAWSQVTCAGVSALEANAASTAAVVLGSEAPEWLAGHGIPARLDADLGRPVVTPGWPNPERRAA